MKINYRGKDHSGKIFGRLVAHYPVGTTEKGGYIIWRCSCFCGKSKDVKSSHLVSGAVRSCGCLAREKNIRLIKATHNKGKHLYFIQCREFIKIGRADNVWDRLSQIQCNNPYPCEIVHIIENEGHREKEFHEMFKEKLVRGEWFEIEGCEVVDL